MNIQLGRILISSLIDRKVCKIGSEQTILIPLGRLNIGNQGFNLDESMRAVNSPSLINTNTNLNNEICSCKEIFVQVQNVGKTAIFF